MSVSSSDTKLAKILEGKGWLLVRVKGSHHRYQKDNITWGVNISICIPIHCNQDLKIGLLKGVMKQANLTDLDLI